MKLEQQLKARDLSPQQQQRIITSIRSFAGTPYELAVNPTPESLHFADQLDGILRAAGWSAKDNASTDFRIIVKLALGTKAEQTLTSGIEIQITKALYVQYGKGAEALIEALGLVGIQISETYLPDSDASPNNVHIMVGSQQLIK